MTRTALIIALAAAAALAGCKENHTIVAGPAGDTDENATANEHVAMPPSIAASKTYRCKDNKLIYIDWLSDGTAHVKKTRDEVGTVVTPGTGLTGDAKASTISYNGQSCKA